MLFLESLGSVTSRMVLDFSGDCLCSSKIRTTVRHLQYLTARNSLNVTARIKDIWICCIVGNNGVCQMSHVNDILAIKSKQIKWLVLYFVIVINMDYIFLIKY